MLSTADNLAVRRSALRGTTALGALGIALVMAAPAWAQTAGAAAETTTAVAASAQDVPQEAPQTPEQAQAQGETIVVTGFRASLANSVNIKKNSNQIVDAITAEDIADFPDANLAESIQRLPGVSIDRDNGEGRTITVRGLGGDFQSVRLNGADAQNIAGGNQSDAGANRSRGFDFNTFASELFGGIKVTKSTAAENDEGSLGAIIDLTTGRPLSYKKNRFAVGAEAEYRENGKSWNPRFTGLASVHVTDNFGILVSGAYQKQEQQIDSYRRNIGVFEYTYRNSAIAGVTPAVYGFARPNNQGTGATFGSDPAAYAVITPTTIIPGLPSIGRQYLDYERIGATATMQWKPSAGTEITLDGVFSRYDQNSDSTGITPIGLNRNGTNARVLGVGTAGLRAIGTANGYADRVALYPNCVPSATIDCNGDAAGNGVGQTPLTGYFNSLNPNNLNPYDYYNNPASPGYVASGTQTGYYNELLGRPNTKIRAAHVNSAGQADYMVLDDVDWRSFSDTQFGRTDFKQVTLNVHQEFAPNFYADATGGWSKSEFRSYGTLTEFNAIDQDNYVFDDRGGDKMPVFSPGFDVANPSSWTLVKGLSTIRYFTNTVDNEFKVARVNFTFDALPEMSIKFGGTAKQFDYVGDQGRRTQSIEAINPTLAESHLNITDLGRTISFGQGLNVSSGTPTSYYAPDTQKFINQFGINCNCVNKWGDFRASVDGRQKGGVTEQDVSGYFQVDYNVNLLGRPLRGNAGLRVANTRVFGSGNVGGADGVAGLAVTAKNEYWDWLPSMNANWEVQDNLLIRFAASKVMSRPQLASLTPGTTAFSSSLATSGAAPSLTVGNPYLNPFRATNLDLSIEKYFTHNGLIAVNLFKKNIDSFPQQVALEAPLSAVFEPAVYQQVLGFITNAGLNAYTQAGGTWAIRQFQDAPGGTIKGVEVNLQSDFFFLPGFLKHFGVIANYTHIDSNLSYLTGTVLNTTTSVSGTAANTYAEGPFLNTSPDAFNATLYYEDSKFSARVSGSWRARYVNRFPLASGTCSVGTTTVAGGPCNSPVFADFGYNEEQLNIDFAMSYALTKFAKLSLEGRNMTNAPQYRTMYAANPVSQTYASTGRIVTAGLRMNF
ncbi:TonB-dependent receptor [Sphingomonas sp. R-74633]|uniref:TonB-dependent receptor domain-containing protein n=1 Tax=Sphingomonas sp. R-74633 TaxID=2751188 RepID=UPI0015D342EE|nr:TonB-dependent receptor [Sphingomonas sp. R-74633]NYT39312.1 TonB-dependent receptor [Sphingomonas sp. R-74633]